MPINIIKKSLTMSIASAIITNALSVSSANLILYYYEIWRNTQEAEEAPLLRV